MRDKHDQLLLISAVALSPTLLGDKSSMCGGYKTDTTPTVRTPPCPGPDHHTQAAPVIILLNNY